MSTLRPCGTNHLQALDSVPVGLCVFTEDFTVVSWNRCLEKWTGISHGDIVGTSLLERYPKFGQPKYLGRIREVFSGGAPIVFSSQLHRYMIPVRYRDDRMRSQHCVVNSIDTAKPNEFHAMLVIQDVTEQANLLESYRTVRNQAVSELRSRKAAEANMVRYTARLEEVNRELQLFASIASHDLRAPMRRIRALADMLTEADPEEAQECIGHIRGSIDRMDTLISDLSTYSRMVSADQPMEPVTLGDVLRDVLADMSSLVNEKGACVEVATSVDRLPALRCNPTQMRQLFQNLISNGIKFSRRGEEAVVRVSGSLAGALHGNGVAMCEIAVEDNGIGIDQKYIGTIFDAFKRLHNASEYEGTGLGLAICAKICVHHGGTIDVRSTKGEGSTFVVRMPLEAIDTVAA